jgi:ribosomal protein L37AE/L43A
MVAPAHTMSDRVPDIDRTKQTCPECHALGARAITLREGVAVLRCDACGEVWAIEERRRSPRLATRAVGFYGEAAS